MTEDEILIDQFKDGDQDAFSKLIDKYNSPILNYVRRKGRLDFLSIKKSRQRFRK